MMVFIFCLLLMTKFKLNKSFFPIHDDYEFIIFTGVCNFSSAVRSKQRYSKYLVAKHSICYYVWSLTKAYRHRNCFWYSFEHSKHKQRTPTNFGYASDAVVLTFKQDIILIAYLPLSNSYLTLEHDQRCLKPSLHESQLQVEWSVTFLYSLIVERRC